MNKPALYEIGVLTGLPLYMLAAVGSIIDIESIYILLKKFPGMLMHNIYWP